METLPPQENQPFDQVLDRTSREALPANLSAAWHASVNALPALGMLFIMYLMSIVALYSVWDRARHHPTVLNILFLLVCGAFVVMLWLAPILLSRYARRGEADRPLPRRGGG